MQDFLFYLKMGWEHIISLDALDHQLFVLVLMVVYGLSDLKKLLILVTSFTIGHSITLVLSALDIVRISTDWIEFLIPITILLTALDNLIMRGNSKGLMQMNYTLALVFGLVHGMGFANIARVAISSEQSLFVPLLGFNIGLELGQIAVVIVLLILSYIVQKIFKVKAKDWVFFISSGVFALSLQMALERIPF